MPTDSTPQGVDELQNELAAAIGQLAIEFGRLEGDVAELTAAAFGRADIATREVVNATIGFRQKLDLIAGLAASRLPSDSSELQEVRACVQHLQRFEDHRNGLLHAFWAFQRDEGANAPGIFVRAKMRSHRAKGLTDHTKAVPIQEIRELAEEIRHFRRIFGHQDSLYHAAEILHRACRNTREA